MPDEGPTEYPGPDELPDDPVSYEDVSPFTVDPANFDTITEFVHAEADAQQSSNSTEE